MWNDNLDKRTFREIERELVGRLKEAGLYQELESFGRCTYDWKERDNDTLDPMLHRWAIAYPVEGENEGHYIHVDAIQIRKWVDDPAYKPKGGYYASLERAEILTIFLGKTFMGWEHAQKVANVCGAFLGQWNGTDLEFRFQPEPEIEPGRPNIADDDIILNHIPDVAECERLLDQANAEKFWPNYWHVNERGNVDQLYISRAGCRIIASWV